MAVATITLVKKIKADGSPCRKCRDVLERLLRDGLMDAIDRVAVADERDPASEGMQLAARHGVDRAPFFLVEHEDGRTEVHTVYLLFARKFLGRRGGARDELVGLMEANPDLDFV